MGGGWWGGDSVLCFVVSGAVPVFRSGPVGDVFALQTEALKS